MPQPPPKFLRDSINVDDIDGTKPRSNMKDMFDKFKTRNHMKTTDIPGAVPKSRSIERNLGPYDIK